MIEYFGAHCSALANRYPLWLSAIIADEQDPAKALDAAAKRRRAGEAFFAMPVVADNRSTIAMQLGGRLFQQVVDRDERRALFDALANQELNVDNKPQASLSIHNPPALTTLRELLQMSDAHLVRSRVDLRRQMALFGAGRNFVCVSPGIDGRVPRVAAVGKRGMIVVWAPEFQAAELALYAFALENFHTECLIACAGGSLPGVRSRFVPADAEALSQAAAIVDVSCADPATTIALSACGVPIAAPSTSGAEEFLDGIVLFDPWNWRSIMSAVSAVRGARTPVLQDDPVRVDRLKSVLNKSFPVSVASISPAPLVSIIVPTYNRPEVLAAGLKLLQAQRYESVEIIVVNDAGTPVDDVVAPFSRVRLINLPKNGGAANAQNVGFRESRGTYLAFISDDDLFYPDFVPRMIEALESNGAAVANGNTVIRFVEKDTSGRECTVGYRLEWRGYMDRLEILYTAQLSMSSCMFRRDAFDGELPFDVACPHGDFALLVRLSRTHDFIHVDHVVCEWGYRMDGSTIAHSSGYEAIAAGYQMVFDRFGNDGSEAVNRGRVATLEWFKKNVGGHYWEPALRL